VRQEVKRSWFEVEAAAQRARRSWLKLGDAGKAELEKVDLFLAPKGGRR
jgi:hypothetical protein